MEEQDIKEPVAVVVKNPGAFKAGHPKWGGRKKGVQNKRTRFAHEVAEKMGVDPARYLLEIIKSDVLQITEVNPQTGEAILNPDGTPKKKWVAVTTAERLDAAKTLMKYMYPALQAMQITGANDGPVAVETLDLTQLLADPEAAKTAQRMALMLAEQRAVEEGLREPIPSDFYPAPIRGSRYD